MFFWNFFFFTPQTTSRLLCTNLFKRKFLKKVDFSLWGNTTEIRGLCLMKWTSEMLQNLSYFWNTKIHIIFVLFFISCYTLFFLNEFPWSMSTYSRAFIKEKNKVTQNESTTRVFVFQKYKKFSSISLLRINLFFPPKFYTFFHHILAHCA